MDTDTRPINWLDAKDIGGKTEREGVREPIAVMTKDKLEYAYRLILVCIHSNCSTILR